MVRKGIRYISFIFVFMCVLLCSGCSITFAWFTDTKTDEQDVTGATASVQILSGGQVIADSENGAANKNYSNTLALTEVTANGGIIAFKNTSNIPVLISVRGFSPRVDEDILVQKSEITFDIDALWLEQNLLPVNTTYGANYYYNAQLEAGDTITFISSFTNTSADLVGSTLTIDLRVEVIAYAGNPYLTNDLTKPWDIDTDSLGWTAWR